jgi:hypothetical protein
MSCIFVAFQYNSCVSVLPFDTLESLHRCLGRRKSRDMVANARFYGACVRKVVSSLTAQLLLAASD